MPSNRPQSPTHEAPCEALAAPASGPGADVSTRSGEPEREPWKALLTALAGASPVPGLQAQEVAALAEWVTALEADLAEPPTAADLSLLGSIARTAYLELRLSRVVFDRGVTSNRGAKVKPALTELRAMIRLKADLLARLSFKREPQKVPGIRERWGAGGNGDGSPGPAEEGQA